MSEVEAGIAPSPNITPRPPPVRKKYGKKRHLHEREEPDVGYVEYGAKRSRVISSPIKLDSRAQPQKRIPLQNTPINTLRPTQNLLDSPFLEPRRPLGPGLHQKVSLPKPALNTRSRHLSHKRSSLKYNPRAAKESPAETLRRKTSEATTALGPVPSKQSWSIPPPPRKMEPGRKITSDDPWMDFSFHPPAESTLVRARKPVLTPPSGTVHNPLTIPESDDTPIAKGPSLRDEIIASRLTKKMDPYCKRHDSILSTDSEDDLGTTFSIFGLTPKPKIHNLPQDLDVPSQDSSSLMKQLCNGKPRSDSVTVRPLSMDISSLMPIGFSPDTDNKIVASSTKQDPTIGALAIACAELNLDQDLSPSRAIKAASARSQVKRRCEIKKHDQTSKPVSSSRLPHSQRSDPPYQLSPRAVHRLSRRRGVGMRIEEHAPSPDGDVDVFALYEFGGGSSGASH